MRLKQEQVEWVVNDQAELGVKIGDQFFFLYKGRSYKGGEKWRYVGKREFGECCHPWTSIEREYYGDVKQARPVKLPETYVKYYREELQPDFDNPWQDIRKKSKTTRRK